MTELHFLYIIKRIEKLKARPVKKEKFMRIKKIFAMLSAIAVISTGFTACDKETESSSVPDEASIETAAQTDAAAEEEVVGDTIYFMSDYDLNPQNGESRSIPLTLFEDVYGGKIEWIPTTQATMYDDLSAAVLGGQQVDMFPYTENALPYGVFRDLYQPLDEYIDFSDELWADMKGLADKMAYNGSYYAVPTNINNPVVLIYSRNAVKEMELEDPYKLYTEGKWTWDAFIEMMKTFEGIGCAGWIGQGIMQSTGQTYVNYDGSVFTSNIENEQIQSAGELIEQISGVMYDEEWYDELGEDILFLGAGSWDIADSTLENKDADVFFVPFPSPDGSGKFVTADINAKMLVKNSQNGEAVAKYLECERVAVTEEKYLSALKKADVESGMTQEQSDFLWQLKNPDNVVFDFAYGMSKAISNASTEYNERGAINNMNDALLTGYSDAPSTWTEIRDSYKSVFDVEINGYKNKTN